MANHACECCGHRTLDDPPGGTYQICPVCFWEDAPFADDSICERFSNGVSLRQAQRHFEQLGAATPDAVSNVRPATEDELPHADWQTIDERAATERALLLANIERAFHRVSRSGGVSLHETQGLDGCWEETAVRELRKKDVDRKWQEVPIAHLDDPNLGDALSFFDPIGWRYYLPAYMTWWVKGGESADTFASESLIYTLQLSTPGPSGLRAYGLERYESLSPQQARATTRFLCYVRDYAEDPHTMEDAQKALDSYWQQFLL